MTPASHQATVAPPRELPEKTRPFLKWAGGKFRVLDHILPNLPAGERLIEPFAGSAAVALNAGFRRALVCDSNADLVNLYLAVRDRLDEFLAEGRAVFEGGNTRAAFEGLRAEFNASADPLRRSVLFVYLNRHGFNGLCRYNSKGQFNVPFGQYKGPAFPEREVRIFHERVQHFAFECGDFVAAMERAVPGDVVYCDPPYVPLSATSNFTSYVKEAFGFAQQKRLAELARECAARGVPVVISNHDTPEAQALYRGARLTSFPVRRMISSKASTRGNAQELLAFFGC